MEILSVCPDFAMNFKRTTHAVQRCKNEQRRCSYGRKQKDAQAPAIADARAAVAARPDWPKAHFRLAKAFLVEGADLNGAANALEESARLLRKARTASNNKELAAVEGLLGDVEARLDASLGEAPVAPKKTECGLAKGFVWGPAWQSTGTWRVRGDRVAADPRGRDVDSPRRQSRGGRPRRRRG